MIHQKKEKKKKKGYVELIDFILTDTMPRFVDIHALYSFIDILFPHIQINGSCVALTSLLAPTLFQKTFLWEQQMRLT